MSPDLRGPSVSGLMTSDFSSEEALRRNRLQAATIGDAALHAVEMQMEVAI